MLLSSNGPNCWFLIIICLISSQISANSPSYGRNDPHASCPTRLLDSVKNDSFSASSVRGNDPDFAPHSARIDVLHDSGVIRRAWCPDKPVSHTSNEWLQIEFSSPKIIQNIFTQGRYDGNYGEYVTNYYFDYQRESGLTWYRYNDTKLGELISGNNDPRNSAYKKFDSPLVVSRIRIIPISDKPKLVCLKIGLYGCDFNDGVVEYQIPRGDTFRKDSATFSFDDITYDGKIYSNQTWLKGGMGKLMDNSILINSTSISEIQNYVVGWKKKENVDFVDLLFRFRKVRQIQSVKLYYSELPPTIFFKSFKTIIVDFLDDQKGSLVRTDTVEVEAPTFSLNKPMFVDLQNKVAKYVRMKLFFNSEWILLNEIVFSSIDVPVSDPVATVQPILKTSAKVFQEISTLPMKPLHKSQNLVYYITLAICIVGTIILSGVGVFLGYLWTKQRQKRRYKNKLYDHRSMLFNDPYQDTRGLRTISGNNPLLYRPLTPQSYVPSINNTAQNVGFRFVHSQFPPCPDYCPPPISNGSDYEAIDSYWPKSLSQSMSFTNHKLDQPDRQTLLTAPAPDITCNNKTGTLYCSTPPYSSNIYSQPDNEINFPAPDILPLSALTQESLNGIYKIHVHNPLQGPLGSTISNFQLAPASQSWVELCLSRIPEIQPNKIVLESLVSDGEIGSLIFGHIENTNNKILVVRYKPNNFRVESKSLFYRQCFSKLKDDFSCHPNLLAIIGQTLTGGIGEISSPSIIYAYPPQMNVVTFFKKLRLVPRTDNVSFACSNISQSSLLYLVKQLAGALSYLCEIGVVHKDVSARNCSIGENFHLILSDFAVGIDEFSDDYIPLIPTSTNDMNQNPVVHLPLLWMPWEAIIMGNYSTKSDIWSFGVTVWEIFTECQIKPYSALHNQNQELSLLVPNIIRNSMLIANNHPSSILPNSRTLDLNQTLHDTSNNLDLSKQIRDIMTECWRSDPATRPSFQKLHSVLCNLIPTSKPMDEYGALYQLIG